MLQRAFCPINFCTAFSGLFLKIDPLGHKEWTFSRFLMYLPSCSPESWTVYIGSVTGWGAVSHPTTTLSTVSVWGVNCNLKSKGFHLSVSYICYSTFFRVLTEWLYFFFNHLYISHANLFIEMFIFFLLTCESSL